MYASIEFAMQALYPSCYTHFLILSPDLFRRNLIISSKLLLEQRVGFFWEQKKTVINDRHYFIKMELILDVLVVIRIYRHSIKMYT